MDRREAKRLARQIEPVPSNSKAVRIGLGISAVLIAASGGLFFETAHKSHEDVKRKQDYAAQGSPKLPVLPEEVLLGASQYDLYLDALAHLEGEEQSLDVDEVEVDHRKQAINRTFKPREEGFEDIKADFNKREEWKKKKEELEHLLHPSAISSAYGFAGFCVGFLGLASLVNPALLYQDRRLSLANNIDLLNTLEQDPSRRLSVAELNTLRRLASNYPPVGGKIINLSGHGEDAPITQPNDKITLLHPQYLAGQATTQARGIIDKDKAVERLVYHSTVQGRLPDRFKHAGIALLLASPHRMDWTKPLFTSYWGAVGPMIHDGGVVNKINPQWTRSAPGRTDFVHRVFMQFKTDDPEQDEARNKFEMGRMIREDMFYQRSALALHALLGTTPHTIPEETRLRLSQVWETFETRLQSVLCEYELSDVLKPVWFLVEPKVVPGWPGVRYEADFGPIQQSLIELERVRGDKSELLFRIWDLMDQTTCQVDKIMGLPEYLGLSGRSEDGTLPWSPFSY